MTQTTDTAPDGRRARSERSRLAIIEALHNLIGEGTLIPTAQQVSERAGVGIRSVFRHFSDMESLFVMADEHSRAKYQNLFAGGNRDGALQERIEHAVEQHAVAYEAVGNVFLSTRAQLWRYDILQEQYARAQRQIRKDLEDWLPELKDLPADQRELIDMLTSFESWNRLREVQGQSRKTSVKLLTDTLRTIITGD